MDVTAEVEWAKREAATVCGDPTQRYGPGCVIVGHVTMQKEIGHPPECVSYCQRCRVERNTARALLLARAEEAAFCDRAVSPYAETRENLTERAAALRAAAEEIK